MTNETVLIQLRLSFALSNLDTYSSLLPLPHFYNNHCYFYIFLPNDYLYTSHFDV